VCVGPHHTVVARRHGRVAIAGDGCQFLDDAKRAPDA
jgi:hypothetical protein